jgi:hypothetical protein
MAIFASFASFALKLPYNLQRNLQLAALVPKKRSNLILGKRFTTAQKFKLYYK